MESNDIKKHLKGLKKEAKELFGWEELQVLKIDKYETETVIHTTSGVLKMSMADLFVQYQFRMKVFVTFSINLKEVKKTVYHEWLNEWIKNIKNMEYGTSMDRLRELLNEYLEPAEESDISYLKKGMPIVLPDGSVAFKSLEFTLWTKKKYSMSHTENQVRSVLTGLGCMPRQVGPTRMRVWSLELPKFDEGKLDLKFETKAPDIMNDDTYPDHEV